MWENLSIYSIFQFKVKMFLSPHEQRTITKARREQRKFAEFGELEKTLSRVDGTRVMNHR